MAELKFLGHYKVPALKEGQEYYCYEHGHSGDCSIKVVEEDNLLITDKDDNIIKREFSRVDVALCCGGDIGIWDVEADKDVPFELEFVPAA